MMKCQSNPLSPARQSSVAPSESVDAKRKAEKIRLLGWLNVGLSAVVVSMSPSIVPALIGACFWIIAIFAVTQTAAWRLDKRASQQR